MKKICLFICLSIFSLAAFSQWNALPSGTTNNLNSVYFTDVNTGFAVGNYGIILKTDNGGTSWTESSLGLNSHFNSVFFSDSVTGYAVGRNPLNHGIIYRTIDAGVSWNIITNAISKELKAVFFPSHDIGFAVGAEGLIIKTTDAGVTWNTMLSGTIQHLNALHFCNVNLGYVVGQNGTVLKTTNGGTNWTTLTGVTYTNYRSVSFTNDAVGFAAGDFGTLVQTSNGGTSWNTENLYGDYTRINSVFCTKGNYFIVFAVGFAGVFWQSEYGILWFGLPSGTTKSLNSVFFCNHAIGYTVGESGTILKTTNSGGVFIGLNDLASQKQTLNIYPNPSGGIINIETSTTGKASRFSLFSMEGVKLLEQAITGQISTADLRACPDGIYLMLVKTEEKSEFRKIIKHSK